MAWVFAGRAAMQVLLAAAVVGSVLSALGVPDLVFFTASVVGLVAGLRWIQRRVRHDVGGRRPRVIITDKLRSYAVANTSSCPCRSPGTPVSEQPG